MLNTINIILLIFSLAALIAFGFLLVSSFKRSVLWGLGVLLVPFVTLFYGIKYWGEVKKPFLVYVGTNSVCLILVFWVFGQMGGMQMIDMAGKINDGSMTEQDAAQFMVSTMDNMERLGAGGREEMLAQMRADPNLTEEDVKEFEALFGQIEAVARGEQESFVNGPQESDQSQQDEPMSEEEAKKRELEAKIIEMESKMALLDDEVIDDEVLLEPESEPDTNIGDMGYPMPKYVDSPIKNQQPAPQFSKQSSGVIKMADAGQYIGDILEVTTRSGVIHKATLVNVSPDNLEFQRRVSGGALTFQVPKSTVKNISLK